MRWATGSGSPHDILSVTNGLTAVGRPTPRVILPTFAGAEIVFITWWTYRQDTQSWSSLTEQLWVSGDCPVTVPQIVSPREVLKCDAPNYFQWSPGAIGDEVEYWYLALWTSEQGILADSILHGSTTSHELQMKEAPHGGRVLVTLWFWRNGNWDDYLTRTLDCESTRPELVIESLPAFGSANSKSQEDDFLTGRVNSVDSDSFRIACYIRVGSGWWNKPFWATPLTSIEDGRFAVDCVTGGRDIWADEYVIYLLDAGVHPPILRGSPSLPDVLQEIAVSDARASR